jgi:hypothetical protein
VRTKPLSGLLLALAIGSQTMPALAQKEAPPQVDPKAMAALEAMGAYLRSLKSFEIDATTATDNVLENGIKVQLDGTAKLIVRRPDRMRVTVTSDRKHREFYYDGKSVTLYGPRVKYYATVAAPPTVGETVQVLAQKYGIELPLADLFLWGTDKARPEDIKLAVYVGPATIAGTPADQYAYRQEGVDWQVWIRTGAKPVPLKLVVTTTSEQAQPEHIVVLRWNVEPKITEKMFAFVPPPGSLKIAIQTAEGKVEAAGK